MRSLSKCISDDDLMTYVSYETSEREDRKIEKHLKRCENCRKRMKEQVDLLNFVSDVFFDALEEKYPGEICEPSPEDTERFIEEFRINERFKEIIGKN